MIPPGGRVRPSGAPASRRTRLAGLAGILGLGLLVVTLTAGLSAARFAPPGPARAALCFAALGLVVTIACRAVGPAPRPPIRVLAACMLGSVVIAALPARWGRGAVTLFGAAVEELVFRRELPFALAKLLAGLGGDPFRGLVAPLLAQVLFAACHFVVPGAPDAFAPGLPFVRLAASGLWLSVLFRSTGTLAVPTLAHFWVNQLHRAGPPGAWAPPSAAAGGGAAALAMLGLLALERGRHRPAASG